jgi:hypothetical protein
VGPWLIITPALAAPAAHVARVSAQALADPAVAAGATAFVVLGVLALLLGTRARRATANGRGDGAQPPAPGPAGSLSGS